MNASRGTVACVYANFTTRATRAMDIWGQTLDVVGRTDSVFDAMAASGAGPSALGDRWFAKPLGWCRSTA